MQSNIDNLQSQMDALSTGANDYYIYAPTSGVIHMDTPYKVGMVLSAGTPLATVASENSDLEVVAYVTLNDRPLLHVGDPCKIAITGLSEYSYGTLTGTVTSIDSDVTASSSGSYYKMTITPDSTYVVSNSGDKVDLSNGMSVTARVEYDQADLLRIRDGSSGRPVPLSAHINAQRGTKDMKSEPANMLAVSAAAAGPAGRRRGACPPRQPVP